MRNSFKELEKLEMENVSMPSDAIKNGVTAEIGMLKYVSSVVEMYFPRIIDLFVGLVGGAPKEPERNTRQRNSRYPDLN